MTRTTTTKSLNLPELEEFSKELLAERWGCRVSLVEAYIRSGQLKQAVATFHNPGLWSDREFYKYKIDDKEREADVKKRYDELYPNTQKNLTNEELQFHVHVIRPDALRHADVIHIECLLDVIENEKQLDDYLHPIANENIVSCPKYLYVTREMLKKYPVKDDYIRAYNFYDLDGNVLIPISTHIPTYDDNNYRIDSLLIKLDSLIIPLEEVKRFENISKKITVKNKSNKKERRQEYILEIMENPNFDIENLPYNPGKKGVKEEVWKIFDKNYMETFEKPKQRRGAFDRAWESLFKVNHRTKMYERI